MPLATHLPFQPVVQEDGVPYLFGHIAAANPQADSLKQGKEVLAIFQGPHAYVSSSWYARENASTWNYTAVHIYGMLEITSGDAVREDMARLVTQYEQSQLQPRYMEGLSPELVDHLLPHILPFRLHISRIEGAAKLSQNRTDADYRTIISQLDKGTAEEQAVAKAMRKRRP